MSLPAEEQELLHEATRAWVQKVAPVSRLQAALDNEHSPGFLAEVSDMGWAGGLIAEKHGGAAVSLRAMAAVFEELGRALVAAPISGAVAAAVVALRDGGVPHLADAWLPKIAAGKAVATLATDEASYFTDLPCETVLRLEAGALILNGAKKMVHEGLNADLLIVTASGSEGQPVLCAVDPKAVGVGRVGRNTFDARCYADFEFVNAPVLDVLGTPELSEKVLDVAAAAISAEGLGLAEQAFEITLDHLRTREQFGRPIGSFQALQHRAARLYGEIEMTRPTVDRAMEALDADERGASALVSLAKVSVNRLMNLATREMIQMHGGIAMTEEHVAGRYLKRARVIEGAFGTTAHHKKRFGALHGY